MSEFHMDRGLGFLTSANLSLKSQDPGAGPILSRAFNAIEAILDAAAVEIEADQQVRGVIPMPDPGGCAGCGGAGA